MTTTPEVIHKSSDVYGISRDLPLNYVSRKGVDDVFIESLRKGKHIVVFGSSKQGKTSLRKRCLKPEEYIAIHCSNKWSLEDIHTNILKRAGFEITQSTKKTSTGKNKIIASLKSKLMLGLSAEVKAEAEKNEQIEKTTVELELDVEDVNDVISALKELKFNKYIILEDFHYLNMDVQRDFAVALKAFHENSDFCFIIIGVWLDENRLIIHNGDLTGRVIPVNADRWSKDELLEVIEEGEKLLNIRFDEKFKKDLLEYCFNSVYIVQEACCQVCENNQIFETQNTQRVIGGDINVRSLVKQIVDQQSGRYNSFITNFADGFQTTVLEMYKWILYPILKADINKLEKGLRYSEIRKEIQSKHPRGAELNPGNLTQSLKSTASLQITKRIQPIILDYDETNLRLNVVDKSFLIWLSFQNKDNLLELASLPTE